MAATISASPTTMVPAMVAGDVEPAVAIDMNPTGSPASAKTSADSMPCESCASGAMVHTSNDTGGRLRIVSLSPAMTWAISIAYRPVAWPITVSVWTCFTVLRSEASSSCKGAVAG